MRGGFVDSVVLSPTDSASIEEQKRDLASHPIYGAIDSPRALRTFVEHHVACVWDFMSLLKSLQRDLAGVELPWRPPSDPEAARLINEIVLDEESDVLPQQRGHGSHFVWYVEAMRELGADTRPISSFLAAIGNGENPVAAMGQAAMPQGAQDFVAQTMLLLEEPLPVRASVFLHGREEVIPRMFLPLARSLRRQGLPCSLFIAYLERHVEVDGGAHRTHAAALLERLLSRAPHLRERCRSAVAAALRARAALWDAILLGVRREQGLDGPAAKNG